MRETIRKLTTLAAELLKLEAAQDAFEYLLITGALAIVVAAAFIVGFETLTPKVAGNSCQSIDTAATPAAQVGSCIISNTPTP